MTKKEKPLYTLIPLENFKALLGIDDRDDTLSRSCLESATDRIESYCKRIFLRKKHTETVKYTGDLLIPLWEYPISKITCVFINDSPLKPGSYNTASDCGIDKDIPSYLSLSPAIKRYRPGFFIKVTYWAGYQLGKIPADLASACLELASWNMKRYKGGRIGMTGNV